MEDRIRPPHAPLAGRPLVGKKGKDYFASPALLAAAHAALHLERPLLLTGEAGCGKTDFAYAAASVLTDGQLATCHVRSDSTARDLLYHHDAVRRFGDAQHRAADGAERAADARHYVTLQGLGRAMHQAPPPVVLIDEIDKAPRDLPNDLLRELDEWAFDIPEIPDPPASDHAVRSHGVPLAQRMATREGARRPFVVVTSNVERQLPEPFLRRCVFHHLDYPLPKQLVKIVAAHLGDAADLKLLRQLVEVFQTLRDDGLGLTKKPATSELIDWAQVLTRIYEPDAVRRRIAQLAEARTVPALADLPAASTLIKLREDRARLSRG